MLEINTVNKAATQHTRTFKAMCRFGDQILGASTEGISTISGYADGDTKINAFVKSGELDFSTPRLKRFRFFYFEVELEGKLKLILFKDGALDSEYEINSDNGRQQTIRVSIDRTKPGLYWSWAVENIDGVFFALHSVRCIPIIGRTLKYANRA